MTRISLWLGKRNMALAYGPRESYYCPRNLGSKQAFYIHIDIHVDSLMWSCISLLGKGLASSYSLSDNAA